MVQNWENFMSPTGGVVDESWQIGMASIGADLFNTFVTIPAINNRINTINNSLIATRTNRATKLQSLFMNKRPDLSHTERRIKVSNLSKKIKTYSPYSSAQTNALKSTKSLTKLISKGFLFMGMASLAESIFSPNYGLSQSATRSNQQGMGPQMIDTEIAYTQRQRALMAIHDSQLGLRGVLGNESQYFHR